MAIKEILKKMIRVMNNESQENQRSYHSVLEQDAIGCILGSERQGIVLLVTLVLLVAISSLGYTLSSRLAARRYRNQYIIDYQAARYGCESALKYAFTMLEDINSPRLIARPNEPDFSDLFALSEVEYEELLSEWEDEGTFKDSKSFDDANYIEGIADSNEPNSLVVRGPYGPDWPFITKPVEFEIGSVKVEIVIEDENAKYPISWAMLSDKKIQREITAGLETFCEWMDMEDEQIDSLKMQLKQIGEIKQFKFDYKPIKSPTQEIESKKRRGRRRRRSRKKITYKTLPASVHVADFAKLFHSSLIDTENLARATIISEDRKESALKYMGLWGSNKVNINTAPRHVLEAAFVFGGKAEEIAEEIIQRRRIKSFTDIDELKKLLLRYSDSIEKCEKYITIASSFFTIRVTAVSGTAEASAVIAIIKDGKKTERIATISG